MKKKGFSKTDIKHCFTVVDRKQIVYSRNEALKRNFKQMMRNTKKVYPIIENDNPHTSNADLKGDSQTEFALPEVRNGSTFKQHKLEDAW